MKNILLLSLLSFIAVAAATDLSKQYEQQFARNPQDYAALYNAGVVAFKDNKLERAKECFDGIKPLSDQQPFDVQRGEQLFYNAGNTEIKLKKYEDAVKSFEKVLTYNVNNEKAREKLEYAKRMLEEQQQEQNNDQENKDDQQKDDQKQQQQNDQQQEERQDQQNHNNNKDEQEQSSKDQQREEEQRKEQEKQQQQKEQKADQQKDADKKEQERQAQQQQQKKQEPELTQEEQQLLAAVQDLDKRMQGALEARKLKKAQGAVHGYHNW